MYTSIYTEVTCLHMHMSKNKYIQQVYIKVLEYVHIYTERSNKYSHKCTRLHYIPVYLTDPRGCSLCIQIIHTYK